MIDEATVRVDEPDGESIARIAPQRPERPNAFTKRIQREPGDAFDRVDADPAVHRARRARGRGRVAETAPACVRGPGIRRLPGRASASEPGEEQP